MRMLGKDYSGLVRERIWKCTLDITGRPELMPDIHEDEVLIGTVDIIRGIKLAVCSDLNDMQALYALAEFPHQVNWFTAVRSKVDELPTIAFY